MLFYFQTDHLSHCRLEKCYCSCTYTACLLAWVVINDMGQMPSSTIYGHVFVVSWYLSNASLIVSLQQTLQYPSVVRTDRGLTRKTSPSSATKTVTNSFVRNQGPIIAMQALKGGCRCRHNGHFEQWRPPIQKLPIPPAFLTTRGQQRRRPNRRRARRLNPC